MTRQRMVRMLSTYDEWKKDSLESHYKNGKKDGLGTQWYENGQKSEEVNIYQERRDGMALFDCRLAVEQR